MEFSTKEDIEAPIDRVFAAVSDFDAIERQILRRGVEVRRNGGGAAPTQGTSWHARFRFRGKSREAEVTMTAFDMPQEMQFQTISGGLEAHTMIEFVALSRSRTRITMTVVLQPKTLSARLLVQSMKLARGNINKRFRVRMADYAKDLETRLKATG